MAGTDGEWQGSDQGQVAVSMALPPASTGIICTTIIPTQKMQEEDVTPAHLPRKTASPKIISESSGASWIQQQRQRV